MYEKESFINSLNNDEYSEPIKFEIGNLAVYPAHGVGRIESIESRVISSEKQEFYIMKILENSMVIMIPVQNVKSVGLRNIIDINEVSNVYQVMKDRNIPQDNQTWNRRYRDYMEKIKTGSLYEVAGVFRDLYLLRLTKELSFGERKLLDTAQCLLVKELAIAKESEENIIIKEIDELFVDAVIESEKENQDDDNVKKKGDNNLKQDTEEANEAEVVDNTKDDDKNDLKDQ